MDIISTALAGAWLEAVARVQSARPPTTPMPANDRTLTDVIERGLRHGSLDSLDPQWVDPAKPDQRVDRLA